MRKVWEGRQLYEAVKGYRTPAEVRSQLNVLLGDGIPTERDSDLGLLIPAIDIAERPDEDEDQNEPDFCDICGKLSHDLDENNNCEKCQNEIIFYLWEGW